MCSLFHVGWPWGLWAGLGLTYRRELLPREPLASSSSYAENCLGNSYKKEKELKKLNSLDFASRVPELGQWMLPSSRPAGGTELCQEEPQQAVLSTSWITASEKSCSPMCAACFVELSHAPCTSMTQESKAIIILEKISVLQHKIVRERLLRGSSGVISGFSFAVQPEFSSDLGQTQFLCFLASENSKSQR